MERLRLFLVLIVMLTVAGCNSNSSSTEPVATEPLPLKEANVQDSMDIATGLLVGEGLQAVQSNCLTCHSSALIVQNRFTREQWHKKIVWMQETQGLWDLGDSEPIILDYLAANYAPEEFRGRRKPLADIEWYEL
ncbi:MAG: monoheme cytochrome C, partial [Bacteroidota bacterium]